MDDCIATGEQLTILGTDMYGISRKRDPYPTNDCPVFDPVEGNYMESDDDYRKRLLDYFKESRNRSYYA